MMEGFVCHPDGPVDPPVEDYPDTRCYTMSPEEFAAADTRQAWSQADPPPEPQPYYEPHHYDPTYHEPPHTHREQTTRNGSDAASTYRRIALIASGIATLLAVAVVAFIGARLAQPPSAPPTPSPPQPSSTRQETERLEPPQTVTDTPPPVTVTPPPVTVTTQPPAPPFHPPSPAPVPTLPPGDLGLPTPMSHPNCNGGGIVVLGNVTTPGMYAAGVQNLLNARPGASYLRTDQACPSLRQASDEGNPIYAVFKFAGTTQREVCTAVRAAGGGAYGKWLDYSTDPAYIIPC
jgi:serine/threonine protein kinase, bacterial